MERTWTFPEKEFIKINMHAIHFPNPLPNGNTSGIGIVLRDRFGTILLLVSGTIPGITERANELWTMLVGFRCAYYEKEYKIQVETDNEDAVKEWTDWRWFLDPNHSGVIQQLEQRKSDPNLVFDGVKVITANQHRLARFLAEDGAMNRTRLVAFRRPFGLVREIWRLDMGLGPLDPRFMMIDEDDCLNQLADEEEVEGLGALLAQDAVSDNAGNINVPA